MKKQIEFITSHDEYLSCDGHHEIKVDGKSVFYQSNLNDCPEDASLERDLTTGDDAISLIELGMKLSKEGYSELDVKNILEE